ncbi:hydroxymethylglutaryl-CoA lyase [Bosea sp. CRIB-10]|uniref:hydroxymethylglutaryl-CoA lyase n=1 Tax=Bosea sp. CRIB-10 TaxID=378404 RepID=UPI0008E852CC|nr:hydroxymethylglutaryl-CoA lyase [Bosea sp. CRIB-10]SFC10081.1 hydroxymethylglutaryl-CoA lyase [Bosea sp. CRIB-10]
MAEPVILREVGLRDGLQMVKTIVSTQDKLDFARTAAAAGLPEIEATSFVPPHIIPQFADAAEVAAGLLKPMGTTISALVVNLKGAARAFDAGLRKVNYVVSASEAHSLANARRSTDAALAEFRLIVADRKARGLDGQVVLGCGIATAFGCTLQGEVSEQRVIEIAESLARDGADEIMAADTVGYGSPRQVRRMFDGLAAALGTLPLAAHFHDTRGLGLANVTAALDAGVRRFDASLGGLGGCPFAPGATGNINTEDTAFMLEALGFDTGVDITALIALRGRVEGWLPGERFSGGISRAGLPKTFRRAMDQAA